MNNQALVDVLVVFLSLEYLVTKASVVRRSSAILPAFCNAVLVTFVGSITPDLSILFIRCQLRYVQKGQPSRIALITPNLLINLTSGYFIYLAYF